MKGLPITTHQEHRYHVTNEDISLPVAVINKRALEHNMDWMQQFAIHHNVKLCPHGKTTMTPAFFQQQKEKGAWGITVATAPQAEIAAHSGMTNIIMANQLVGKTNMAMISRLIEETESQVICCVDSQTNVDQLNTFFAAKGQTINVLIELGVEGGRCGVRSHDDVMTLAQYIEGKPNVKLVGIEVYEGVIHGGDEEQRVRDLLTSTIQLGRQLLSDKLLPPLPILTGAGSAWYDVVAETLANLDDFEAIIRPGCYVIHDTGIYLEAQEKVMARAQKNSGFACDLGGDLTSSLEVWAYVISRPEPNKAVVGLGKRDVAFDAGLPTAERRYRNGKALPVNDITTTNVMDQHTFLAIPTDSDIQVGDMIAFSTSHPCLTFDKWRYIAISNDEHVVEQWVETAF
ncbi:amino acid deaminase [Vibrio sp. ZSDZ65]|uniref:Amino acid deaminase n=2 Tax=Vibrio qingdaonensis TaxID=2829491 RepID=A0A9X3HVZ9_9VIBR|nr:amino acid deaminase [Vibrio qingdaonensis]MCW8345743.1 amino acid deaminase [Vibrio qingdaonensis]